MKNILMILVVAAIAMTSCKDDRQNLSDSFDKLQKESAELLQKHAELKNHHNNHVASHSSVSQRMAGVALEDSTWLETLANHEVVLKSHEADLQKVEQLLAGHSELKTNFGNLTTDEKQAQIDAMSNDLDEINDIQSTLSSDHDRIDSELSDIEENFRKQRTDARERQ